MNVKSRFSSSAAVDFEFESDPEYANTPTLYVSLVTVNFGTQPCTAGQVQLIYADDQGEDMIDAISANKKNQISFKPIHRIAISKGAKLIVRYANPNSVETTARFFWSTCQ